jgi:ribosomal protein L30/L7E
MSRHIQTILVPLDSKEKASYINVESSAALKDMVANVEPYVQVKPCMKLPIRPIHDSTMHVE